MSGHSSRGRLPNYSFDPSTDVIHVRPREGLLRRVPCTESRNKAFDQLHERLAIATEFFLHHGDGGRYGVFRAMGDIMEFLTSRGLPHATLEPIQAVMAAIVDADNGVSSPIFQPLRSTKGGTPPKPVMQLDFEGKLAIVMECCVRQCRMEGKRPFIAPAAQLAAKLIQQSGWPVEISPRQLVELRERIQQTSKDSADRRAVEESLSSHVAQAMPLEWAKCLLSHDWVNPPSRKNPSNPGC